MKNESKGQCRDDCPENCPMGNCYLAAETEANNPGGATVESPPICCEGSWPEHCEQRAFVAGAKWWQLHKNGSTMFPSERDEAEAEAVKRYGNPS